MNEYWRVIRELHDYVCNRIVNYSHGERADILQTLSEDFASEAEGEEYAAEYAAEENDYD